MVFSVWRGNFHAITISGNFLRMASCRLVLIKLICFGFVCDSVCDAVPLYTARATSENNAAIVNMETEILNPNDSNR